MPFYGENLNKLPSSFLKGALCMRHPDPDHILEQFPQGGTIEETGNNNPTVCAKCGCSYRRVRVCADIYHRLSLELVAVLRPEQPGGFDGWRPQIGPPEVGIGILGRRIHPLCVGSLYSSSWGWSDPLEPFPCPLYKLMVLPKQTHRLLKNPTKLN